MIEYITGNYLALIEGGVIGGLIVGLWIVARDRRKAVDRLYDCGLHAESPADFEKRVRLNGLVPPLIPIRGGRKPKQDAPGRVIARSVKRVTKETDK